MPLYVLQRNIVVKSKVAPERRKVWNVKPEAAKPNLVRSKLRCLLTLVSVKGTHS